MSYRDMTVFPDWLTPHKNEWMSMGTIATIMQLRECGFTSWFISVRSRLRSVRVPARNGTLATNYLVKHVWAAAKAHGLEPIPTSRTRSPAERIAELEGDAAKLRWTLSQRTEELRQAMARLHNIEKSYETKTHSRSVLAMALRMTEPKPLPGVYFLLSEEKNITYVGQSQNVLGRMSGHSGKDFHSVRMIHVEDKDERMFIEKAMIELLQPKDNTMLVNPIILAQRRSEVSA
jgi:hypothetical protein